MSPKPSAKNPKRSEPEIRQISTSLINDPVTPGRKNLTPESVESLARSIKQIGLIQPLTVRKINGEFEVIAGHRRLKACQILKRAKIPCVIIETKGQEADIIKLHENIYREDLNPIDEGHFFQYLKETYNLTNDEIAAKIQKSVGYVRDRVDILTYPAGLTEALERKQLNFSVAKELVKIDDPLTLKDYVDHAIKSGVTGLVASQWARDFKLRKTYKKAEPKPSVNPPIKEKTSESALDCFICQGKVDPKFARIAYIHPDCAKTIEETGKAT